MDHKAAVLTGDLVASSRAGVEGTDAAMTIIRSVATAETGVGTADVRFERFRGDGWQIYCSDPARAFRLTVLVLAHLQSRPTLPRTRISVAVGTVTSLPDAGLGSASGEVFTLSGRTLDSMGRARLLFTGSQPSTWQAALFSYLDWQSSRWSAEQAEAIALAFRSDPPHPGTSAQELGITRQAFSARLDGAGYAPVCDADRAFRTNRIDRA